MHKFPDSTGDEWSLALTLGAAMRIADVCKVDLLAPEQGDPPTMTRLASDQALLGTVIAELLSAQFETRGIKAEDMYARMDGAVILAANEAFWAELTDFTRCRGLTHAAKALAKQADLIKAASEAAGRRIDSIDVSKVVAKAMSGESPASPESTPAPSP